MPELAFRERAQLERANGNADQPKHLVLRVNLASAAPRATSTYLASHVA
jgi:hypothetical protein